MNVGLQCEFCLASYSYDVRIPQGANPPTYYLKSIFECFPLLDLHEADLSGPVSETVGICQVLHSSSQYMLDTPFAGTINTHTQITTPKLTHKRTCLKTKELLNFINYKEI